VTKKWGGGSEARKPKSLKSGGLKPSSLIEVYAYVDHSSSNSVTFLEPSKVVLELITEFIKTMVKHFGISVAFVRAVLSEVNSRAS